MSPESCDESCHSWLLLAQTFVSNCPSGFASGISPSPRRHEMEPALQLAAAANFSWSDPAHPCCSSVQKLVEHKMHNQSWPLALLTQMKIVLMRPHASYLYFNLLEGKVYSCTPFPSCTLLPSLRRLLPLGLMKFWIRPTRELHRHANARIYAHISSKSCSCTRTQRGRREGGVADICVCSVWPCAVTLPRAGLNFWRATFNFCSLG